MILSGAPKFGAPRPPPAQLIATRNSAMPIVRMMVPVTIGGKKRISRPKNGAISTANTPAAMVAPKIVVMPASDAVIATIGPTGAKPTPMMTGRRMPNFHTPMH